MAVFDTVFVYDYANLFPAEVVSTNLVVSIADPAGSSGGSGGPAPTGKRGGQIWPRGNW